MIANTLLGPRQMRLQQWADDIRDCNARPEGMTVDDWCKEHDLKINIYYWRMAAVRRACIEVVERQAISES